MRRLVTCFFLLGISEWCGFNAPACLAQERVTHAPILQTIRLSPDEVTLQMDLAVPWSWEGVTFKSRQTFPAQLPTLPPTRHQLSFGLFEPGMVEWFQFDFIQIGTYQVVDDLHIRVNIQGDAEVIGAFDPTTHTLVFDGLEYDPMIPLPTLRVLRSLDLIQWEPVTNAAVPHGEHVWSLPVMITMSRHDEATAFFKVERID